jgi:hypothetical protein
MSSCGVLGSSKRLTWNQPANFDAAPFDRTSRKAQKVSPTWLKTPSRMTRICRRWHSCTRRRKSRSAAVHFQVAGSAGFSVARMMRSPSGSGPKSPSTWWKKAVSYLCSEGDSKIGFR